MGSYSKFSSLLRAFLKKNCKGVGEKKRKIMSWNIGEELMLCIFSMSKRHVTVHSGMG